MCVLNNGDLNMVTWEMRAFEGNPRFEESQDVPSFPYAEFAEMIGLPASRVEKPEEVGPAWDQLLAADRPSVLEVVCDPDVPTIPPHVTLDQFGKYMSSLLKGDSETLGSSGSRPGRDGSRSRHTDNRLEQGMRKRATSIALAGLLALAACSGTTGATTSEALTDTTLAGTSGGTGVFRCPRRSRRVPGRHPGVVRCHLRVRVGRGAEVGLGHAERRAH